MRPGDSRPSKRRRFVPARAWLTCTLGESVMWRVHAARRLSASVAARQCPPMRRPGWSRVKDRLTPAGCESEKLIVVPTSVTLASRGSSEPIRNKAGETVSPLITGRAPGDLAFAFGAGAGAGFGAGEAAGGPGALATGAAVYVNTSLETALPPSLMTVTGTPAGVVPAGLTAVIFENESTVKLAAGTSPKRTLDTLWMKPVPVIVTDVPPAIGPEVALSPVIGGAGV